MNEFYRTLEDMRSAMEVEKLTGSEIHRILAAVLDSHIKRKVANYELNLRNQQTQYLYSVEDLSLTHNGVK